MIIRNKKIAVVYRNNDLFDAIIDSVLALAPEGVEITKHVIPKGDEMNSESAQKVLGEVFEQVKNGAKIFPDDTCRKEIQFYSWKDRFLSLCKDGDIKEELFSINHRTGYRSIDDVLSFGIKQSIGSNAELSYRKIADLILPNRKSICVIVDHLADHYNAKEIGLKLRDVEDRISPIKQFLLSNFTNENVVFKELENAEEEISNDEVLIVVDRHVKEFVSVHNNVMLLPFDSALYKIICDNLLNLNLNFETQHFGNKFFNYLPWCGGRLK